MIGQAEIAKARERISSRVRRTPLVRNRFLSDSFDTGVYLKLEVLQETGSFKSRGAFNKMLALTPEERRRGAVVVSGGNHGQAAAFAARELGMKCVVLMPENTSPNSKKAVLDYGAELVLTASLQEAFSRAEKYRGQGRIFIHPFDDPEIIAGQGTLGLELLEDLPELTDCVVSIGGGGMIGGIASALKPANPAIRIWGVETEGADAMSRALKAGRVVTLPAVTSIAKTLGAPAVSELTLGIVRECVNEVVVVSDAEAYEGLETLLERAKILTEPAASCTLAAARRLRGKFSPESRVVLVLCGGNISLSELRELDQRFNP